MSTGSRECQARSVENTFIYGVFTDSSQCPQTSPLPCSDAALDERIFLYLRFLFPE